MKFNMGMTKKSKVWIIIFITLLLIGGIYYIKSSRNLESENPQKDNPQKDNPKMLMVDGQVYIDMGLVNSMVTCGTPDGEVLSSVSRDKSPRKDNESNFGEGYEYQILDKKHINVNIDNKWIIFQNIAISSWQIPEEVANFKAELVKVDDDEILVKITELSDDFNWIFGFKDIDDIGDISLNPESLKSLQNNKNIKLEELLGRQIKIYFDGEVNTKDKIEIPNVYEIQILDDKKKSLKIGTYFARDEELSYLTLKEDNSFVLNRDLSSSYLPSGRYEVDGDYLNLYSEGVQKFKIEGDNLIFQDGEDNDKFIKYGEVFTYEPYRISLVKSEKLEKKIIEDKREDSPFLVYSYGGDFILEDGKEIYSLEEAFKNNIISVNEILEKAEKDLKEGKISGDIYEDGGSKIYKYKTYNMIKLNSLEGDRDLYFLPSDMDINDI